MTQNVELTPERRDQIVSAALKEFSEKGYTQASTNAICKEAGVSKGLLFHYFSNKKSLYLFVVDQCISNYKKSFDRLMANLSEDIVERVFQITELKMKIFAEDPRAYSIVLEAFIDVPRELTEEIKLRQENLHNEYLPQFFSGINMDVFRKGIDPQKALELISLITDGVSEKLIKDYKTTKDRSLDNLQNYCSLLYEYMDMLKHGIYQGDSGGETDNN